MNAIEKIEQELKGKSLDLKTLHKDMTALFVVDMVVGFVYSGALSSPRVAKIVNNIVELNKKTVGYNKVFFLDNHEKDSQEFRYFPAHCVEGTEEAELISELKTEDSELPNTHYIKKNSTNAFHCKGFKEWLQEYENQIDNYIITGCVTDICVLQFALSLKSYFNENNIDKRVIVPASCVETYDGGSHDGNLLNLFSLYNMHTSGIEIIDKIN